MNKGFTGRKHSEETKIRMSEMRIGIKRSLEARKKMSEGCIRSGHGKWMLGKKHSEETKRKIGLANKGRERPPFSEEWRRKISEAHKKSGLRPNFSWLGKKHSIESRKKMSEALKGRAFSEEHKARISESKKGSVISIEARQKMSEALRGPKSKTWRGLKPVYAQIRMCFKNKDWIKKVLKRDSYTCQLCGQVGWELEVDHFPVKFSEILQKHNIKSVEEALLCVELWDINNGRTLCKRCHRPFLFKNESIS